MMLEHLREEKAASDIAKGLTKILSEGKFRTRDMGGKHSTSEMGEAIKKTILDLK